MAHDRNPHGMSCFPISIQCDRSAVGAWRLAVPRVARRLAALAPARPTAISSTAPRSRNQRSAVGASRLTVPRSVRGGWRFRGSREGSLRSPPRDPRLFHRPLRGRGTNAPRSRIAPQCHLKESHHSRPVRSSGPERSVRSVNLCSPYGHAFCPHQNSDQSQLQSQQLPQSQSQHEFEQ